MSEPDRFEAQALELVHRVDGMTYGHSDDERAAVIAAALRQADASALERAAQAVEHRYFGVPPYEAIRALIPPAAAPEAVTMHPPTSCAPSATIPPPSTATLEDAGISQPTMYAAPAAEPGKARCWNADGTPCSKPVAPAPDLLVLLRQARDWLDFMVKHPGDGAPLNLIARIDATLATPAPAEAQCPFDEQDCLDARQLLRECEEALSTVGCHPDGEALAQAVLKKLRARAAPTKETT